MIKSTEPPSLSWLRESALACVTGNEGGPSRGDVAGTHGMTSEVCPWERFSNNDYSIPPIFCLWWILLLTSEVSYWKRKLFYTKPWGCFHPRDLQIHLPRWNVSDYSLNKSFFTSKNYSTSDIAQVFLFFIFGFLHPLDSAPYREWFSEAITEPRPSNGIGNDWDIIQ